MQSFMVSPLFSLSILIYKYKTLLFGKQQLRKLNWGARATMRTNPLPCPISVRKRSDCERKRKRIKVRPERKRKPVQRSPLWSTTSNPSIFIRSSTLNVSCSWPHLINFFYWGGTIINFGVIVITSQGVTAATRCRHSWKPSQQPFLRSTLSSSSTIINVKWAASTRGELVSIRPTLCRTSFGTPVAN